MTQSIVDLMEAFFWDFDGVLMNSNAVRDKGFLEVLKEFPNEEVDQLMTYHKRNGGLSRYVKFRYFFETIRSEVVTEERIKELSGQFSIIMRQLLVDESLLIQETIAYVLAHHKNIPMHVVSGSDQDELRFICAQLNIATAFKSIHGSPTPKRDLIRWVVEQNGYNPRKCVMIGDSINDYEAALINDVPFMAYNNPELESKSQVQLDFKKVF